MSIPTEGQNREEGQGPQAGVSVNGHCPRGKRMWCFYFFHWNFWGLSSCFPCLEPPNRVLRIGLSSPVGALGHAYPCLSLWSLLIPTYPSALDWASESDPCHCDPLILDNAQALQGEHFRCWKMGGAIPLPSGVGVAELHGSSTSLSKQALFPGLVFLPSENPSSLPPPLSSLAPFLSLSPCTDRWSNVHLILSEISSRVFHVYMTQCLRMWR